MGRNTGAQCRVCRRIGEKIFLKGNRCLSDKCAVEKRPFPPGQVKGFKSKLSNYGLQLKEKQKVKKIYGLYEKQFKICFQNAEQKKGVTGTNLLRILETRIDNVVYRLGLGLSRSNARQMISHGFFCVNGKKVDIASYAVREGDKIQIKNTEDAMKNIRKNMELTQNRVIPEWLSLDANTLVGTLVRLPNREEMDQSIQEQLIVELYSK